MRPGKRFLWEVDGGERKELWFDFIYSIQEDIRDLQTHEVFRPVWIDGLRSVRSSTFRFSYDLVVVVYPSVGLRIVGEPETTQFQSGFVVERPYWKHDRTKTKVRKSGEEYEVEIRNALVQETANHFEASLHYIIEWVNRVYGGTPPFFQVFLVRFRVEQDIAVPVRLPKPKVKRIKKPAKPVKPPKAPKKPAKPVRKRKPKPLPRREYVVRRTPKRVVHVVIWRDPKTGRFARRTRPGKRRRR